MIEAGIFTAQPNVLIDTRSDQYEIRDIKNIRNKIIIIIINEKLHLMSDINKTFLNYLHKNQ